MRYVRTQNQYNQGGFRRQTSCILCDLISMQIPALVSFIGGMRGGCGVSQIMEAARVSHLQGEPVLMYFFTTMYIIHLCCSNFPLSMTQFEGVCHGRIEERPKILKIENLKNIYAITSLAWSVDVQCDTCQLNIVYGLPKVACQKVD
jgi:hypothetical protein